MLPAIAKISPRDAKCTRRNNSQVVQQFQGGFDFSLHGPCLLGVYMISLGSWYQMSMPRNGVIFYNWIHFSVPIRYSDLFKEVTVQSLFH